MDLFQDQGEEGSPELFALQRNVVYAVQNAYRKGHKRVLVQAPCGAGKTIVASEITRLCLDKQKHILHIAHRRRLVDQMVKTLASFKVTAAPLMAERQTWQSSVYCASRDTLLAMLDAGVALPRPDLIVWDECHVAAHALQAWYLQNCPEAWWIGMTATPVRPDGSSLRPPYEAMVQLGSPQDLIRIGRLCPVKVYNPDAVGKLRRKGGKVKPVGNPVDHWLKYAKGMPTVVYAATVNESKRVVQEYQAAGITAEHMDASTSDDDREAIFERSRTGATMVISNCNVLIEGVDLPWLVCCQILRGCNSIVLWLQATGRVMRPFPGKANGIALDHAGAAHEFGFPDGDFAWSLDDEGTLKSRNKPPAERKPMTCPACGFVFSGKSACPECGRVLPQKRRKSLLEQCVNGDGVLTEFTDRQSQYQAEETLVRLAKKCYHIALARGGTMGMANAIFRTQTKVNLWEVDLPLSLPRGAQWKIPAKDWRLHVDSPSCPTGGS